MTDVPAGYDEDEVTRVVFTQAELDMLYFAGLHHIGHPQAQEYELQDDGFETLVKALKRIQDHMEWLETNGEPDLAATQ